jgi:integration host factor subunit beta
MIKSQLVLRIAGQNPHLFRRDVEKAVNAILDESRICVLGVTG